jgi:hypothetical protein
MISTSFLQCTTFADLERLVVTMEPVYLKYEIFDEAPKVLATLQTFCENYKRALSGLRDVWACLQDEESISAQIQERLVAANEALRAAAALGAHFVRKDASSCSKNQCPYCGEYAADKPPHQHYFSCLNNQCRQNFNANNGPAPIMTVD